MNGCPCTFMLYVRIYQVYFVGECQSSLSYLNITLIPKITFVFTALLHISHSYGHFGSKLILFGQIYDFHKKWWWQALDKHIFYAKSVPSSKHAILLIILKKFCTFCILGAESTTFGKNMMYMYIYGCPCTSCSTEILGFKCSIIIFYLVRNVRLAYHACIKIVHWFQL